MPLDLGQTMLQLDRVSRGLVADSGQREARLTAFVDAAQALRWFVPRKPRAM